MSAASCLTSSSAQKRRRLKSASALAASFLIAYSPLIHSPVSLAKPTSAGVEIKNTAIVVYAAGGVTQPALTSETSIIVDRNVLFTVTDHDNAPTIAAPGNTESYTTFKVTNLSNDAIDLELQVQNQATGETVADGVKQDSFDVSNLKLFIDSDPDGNPDGLLDPAKDKPVQFLDELDSEQSALIFVRATVPMGIKNQRVAGVRLVATAREAGEAGVMGVKITATTTPDTDGVDTVLSDLNGQGDSKYDGVFGALDTWSVFNANLTLIKRIDTISSPLPVRETTPLIPGSKVEICVIAANGEGNNTARGVLLSDYLPIQFLLDEQYGIFVNGTETNEVCNQDGQRVGKMVGRDVTGTIAEIGSGQSFTLRYRATVR